ncbi:hypothetical protein DFH29DRAFT_762194, partial [Suillus ampliporus]
VLKQFDIPKKQADRDEEAELHELARDIDLEDESTIAENSDGDPNVEDADNMEGWTDEVEALTDDERDVLDEQIRPVRLVLVKLRKLSYKVIHSSTLLLPEWKQILAEHKLPVWIMPRDVSTRWNSTFDMLDFALRYRRGIDAMTDQRKLGLGSFELNENDWMLAEQLRDTLK